MITCFRGIPRRGSTDFNGVGNEPGSWDSAHHVPPLTEEALRERCGGLFRRARPREAAAPAASQPAPVHCKDTISAAVTEEFKCWGELAELPQSALLSWLGIHRSRWKSWYGKVNDHNSRILRDHWLQRWEREASIVFGIEHPMGGCRWLTFMTVDADVVTVNSSSVYRVLKRAGLLNNWR